MRRPHMVENGVLLLEARERPGGRIRSIDEAGRPAADGFDLGASWVWPEAQPGVVAQAEVLGRTGSQVRPGAANFPWASPPRRRISAKSPPLHPEPP